jgi:AcrR family transcriptional regulator
MPKVSQEYRDARRAQIIGAARRCFLRDGFHQTSMQDLFAESGLSSGAVYRYFASKDDVVLAIAEENVRDIVALIRSLADGHPDASLGDVLGDVLGMISEKDRTDGLASMSLLVWSEIVRNPELAERLRTSVAELRHELTEVVRTYQANGSLPADAPAEAMAKVFTAIAPGYILQLALFGSQDVADVPGAAAALWPAASGAAGPSPRARRR